MSQGGERCVRVCVVVGVKIVSFVLVVLLEEALVCGIVSVDRRVLG